MDGASEAATDAGYDADDGYIDPDAPATGCHDGKGTFVCEGSRPCLCASEYCFKNATQAYPDYRCVFTTGDCLSFEALQGRACDTPSCACANYPGTPVPCEDLDGGGMNYFQCISGCYGAPPARLERMPNA